jgi:hypothetical protein
MNILCDNKGYILDVQKIAVYIKNWYQKMDKTDNGVITLKNGKTIQIGKKSLLRTGMKQLIGTFLVPIMKDLYESNNLKAPVYERHTDVIYYFLCGMIDFFALVIQNGNLYVETDKSDIENVYSIRSVSTIRRSDRYIGQGEKEKTIEAEIEI